MPSWPLNCTLSPRGICPTDIYSFQNIMIMTELLQDKSAGAPSARPAGLSAAVLHKIVTWWAIGGGGVFCAIVLMSIVSIVGRKLVSTPIEGDMELLMMGAAVGSAAFLPLCEIEDHHVRVDALTNWMSESGRAVLDSIAHGLMVCVASLFAWRTALYAIETHKNMEVSQILLIPLWQPVLMMVPSFLLLALTALWRVSISLQVVAGERV